jgi:hypothetical protein
MTRIAAAHWQTQTLNASDPRHGLAGQPEPGIIQSPGQDRAPLTPGPPAHGDAGAWGQTQTVGSYFRRLKAFGGCLPL